MRNKSVAYKVKPLVTAAIIVVVLMIIRTVLLQFLPPAQADIVKFMTIFLSILMSFIFLVVFLNRLLGGNVSARLHQTVFIVLVVGIVLGVIGMFQPVTLVLFRYGFFLLFASLMGFMVWTHIPPRTAGQEQEQEANLQEMLATGLVSPLEDLAGGKG